MQNSSKILTYATGLHPGLSEHNGSQGDQRIGAVFIYGYTACKGQQLTVRETTKQSP